jgi:hypothetical protein
MPCTAKCWLAVCAADHYKDPTTGLCEACKGGGANAAGNTQPSCSCNKVASTSPAYIGGTSYDLATGCLCTTAYTKDDGLMCTNCAANYWYRASDGTCNQCLNGATCASGRSTTCDCSTATPTNNYGAGSTYDTTSTTSPGCSCATGYKKDTRTPYNCLGDGGAPLRRQAANVAVIPDTTCGACLLVTCLSPQPPSFCSMRRQLLCAERRLHRMPQRRYSYVEQPTCHDVQLRQRYLYRIPQ